MTLCIQYRCSWAPEVLQRLYWSPTLGAWLCHFWKHEADCWVSKRKLASLWGWAWPRTQLDLKPRILSVNLKHGICRRRRRYCNIWSWGSRTTKPGRRATGHSEQLLGEKFCVNLLDSASSSSRCTRPHHAWFFCWLCCSLAETPLPHPGPNVPTPVIFLSTWEVRG